MNPALLIVGVNHQTAPVQVRERLAYDETEIVPALLRLKARIPPLTEAAMLSTCNRVEVISATRELAAAAPQIVEFLALDRGVEKAAFESALYRFEEGDAARHLFRVGASLDSMVVGEPQILGQLKLA